MPHLSTPLSSCSPAGFPSATLRANFGRTKSFLSSFPGVRDYPPFQGHRAGHLPRRPVVLFSFDPCREYAACPRLYHLKSTIGIRRPFPPPFPPLFLAYSYGFELLTYKTVPPFPPRAEQPKSREPSLPPFPPLRTADREPADALSPLPSSPEAGERKCVSLLFFR